MMEKEDAIQYRKEWMVEVLKLLHSRLSHLNEILRLTKDISESLSRNDRVSVQLLLDMRGQEIEKLEGDIKKIQLFKGQFPEETQTEIEAFLQGTISGQESAVAKKIIEIVESCKKVLEQVIAIDRNMSKRVAGADSFYQ